MRNSLLRLSTKPIERLYDDSLTENIPTFQNVSMSMQVLFPDT